MLIVNQNKKSVINLNSIEFIYCSLDGNIEAYPLNGSGEHIFGNYETEEKAKNVLQQIWSAYANGDKVFLMP